MLLKDYIPNVKKELKNIFFSGIAFESSKVKKNDIFFAIKGNNFDGNKYINEAIKKGAVAIISEKKINLKKKILYINTHNPRKLLAEVSFKIYNKIPKNLIAITGTNGKSSVADFYYQLLKLNHKKIASIGTLGVKSKHFNLSLSNTTIDPLKLGQILTKLKNKKIENVIMEASSHGLKQNRLDGLKFNIGIFTNLSQDHLDYHKNLKNYLQAKLYLFKNLIKNNGNIITDENIPEFQKIKRIAINKKLNLNFINHKKNNFQILSHDFQGESQILKIRYDNSIRLVKLNLIGKIQLKNLLMAIIAAKKSKLKLKKIFESIPKIKPVEGRFQKIGKIKNGSMVILDYAHTPEALKTCLLNLREQFPFKKISLLFGCGGNRDQNKRAKMGKIANDYSDKIYLTDDNPRFEDPEKIRRDIKKAIFRKNMIEISNRKNAIKVGIEDLNTGDILLVAGKGHEKTQDTGHRKVFFSDKKIILESIKVKNFNLTNNLKLNLVKEVSGFKNKLKFTNLKKAKINSKEVKKNDIFFAIKGKKNDGNKFVQEALKRKASIAVVNKIQKNLGLGKQIKVKNSLKCLTQISNNYRKNIDTKIIAITGSCGKTTLKELLGNSLKKISRVSISPKSYNNKYGVPLSLFNLNKNDDYGVLEIGMDKKGEIDYLSNIIKPDVSVITNINYAHIKNFKNIKQIALAKSEIIYNTRSSGYVILNADDNFFKLHNTIAKKKKLKVISFGIKNNKANIKFINIKKVRRNFIISIKLNNLKKMFIISNNYTNNIYNILASVAVMSIYINIAKLSKNIFFNFKIPNGRGNLSKIKINGKKINLIDESYNSNPLSLQNAILNYDKLDTKASKKYLLLGDMLELGKHSKKLHQSIAPIINKTKLSKVFIKGKKASFIYDGLAKSKKGKVLRNKYEIINLIKNDLNNNDYLMLKASNATGFNQIVNEIKGLN